MRKKTPMVFSTAGAGRGGSGAAIAELALIPMNANGSTNLGCSKHQPSPVSC